MAEQNEGGDALIHLRVPAATKGRWVRDSRADGQRLTDWIVQRVERPMNVFKIPEALASKYHGSGHALAASVSGQLVDLVYLADALPDFDPDAPGAVLAAINSPAIAPAVRRLQALGAVHVGMCSAWEFCEL